MDSENVFDIYSTPAAPSSRKKTSKRHPGESSKAPQATKPRTAGVPEDGPSANATPPPSPHEKQTPPAPAGLTSSPPAPVDKTQQDGPASTGGDIPSCALKLVKDKVAKILKHEQCREAMAGTEMMDVDQILNRALNEFASEMLTLTAGRLRSGAVT
ncbi:lysine-rich arabinogalactan protein 18-like [Humulus lupulus]|uniref:lysine-rich arabinogalactan protein 18-like n=1 Tax=Humulus lupulus TaxID=3486 RepID=UPI002B40C559|nr:lysine-rich arabinogalactan protein 18-like [Humulus lupulus]